MPQENTTKRLIINQLTKEQYSELVKTSQLSSSELYVITDDNHYTEEEIIKLLSTKQDKLIVGDGINVTDDSIISVDLDKIYTKEELEPLLEDKADKFSAGYSLEYSDNTLILRNINGTILSYVTIKTTLKTDNITVNYNENEELQSIGEITKKNTPKYTWIGTQEEYDTDFQNGIIDEYTECLITDSEEDSITPIVQFEAPTKLSELANDMDFTTNSVVQEIKIELENKIPPLINDENLVHKSGSETINGLKIFTEELTIQNDKPSGRIVHKNTTGEIPSITDGYIEFGENTLKYGKESEQGILYNTENNIFHSGNLIAGENITIIKEDNGIYKINGQAGSGDEGESEVNINSSLPMFTHFWSDHIYNDVSYLRADTFSWHYYNIYKTGYEILEEQYNNENSILETKNGITFKCTPDGFRIADISQQDTIRLLYENTGIAWYYIIDTENKRFKLPRTAQPLATQMYLYFYIGNYKRPETTVDLGEVTETLNNKVDLDSKNYIGSPLETYINEQGNNIYLNKSQITNCITEIPQNIKLELNNGTLTLKAGSIAIAPFGTLDLTSNYPIGSVFQHENFKVVDTLFVKGKFFVWAEVQSDMECVVGTSDITAKCFIDFADNTFRGNALNNYSGSTAPSYNSWWYDTTNNTLGYWNATSQQFVRTNCSLPLAIATSKSNVFARIDQIFNGMGYIGSTVWVDKGVKGLIPNGRNENGTLRNIEFEVSELTAFKASYASSGQYTLRFFIDKDELYKNKLVCGKNLHWINKSYIFNSKPTSFDNGRSALWIKEDTNEIFVTGDGGNTYLKLNAYACCDVTFSTTQITSFNPKQPFRAVDYSDLSVTIDNEIKSLSKAYITETYQNGTSWYRVYSDGWCEQGGYYTHNNKETEVTIELLKTFANTNYNLQITKEAGTSPSSGAYYSFMSSYVASSKTTTQFKIKMTTNNRLNGCDWQASGYIS